MSEAEPALNLVVIRSGDLAGSERFYTALGVRLARERHGNGPEHLAGAAGAVVLEVYPQVDGGSTAGVRLGFRVAALTDVLTAVQAAGGVVQSPARQSPWGLRAVVIDPDGHRVELVQAE